MKKTSKANSTSYLGASIAVFLLCLPLMLDMQTSRRISVTADVETLTLLLLAFQPCIGVLFSWYSKWSRALWVTVALASMLFYVAGEQISVISNPAILLAQFFVLPLLLLVTIVNFSICFIKARKHKTTL